jgi:hypothetical protein
MTRVVRGTAVLLVVDEGGNESTEIVRMAKGWLLDDHRVINAKSVREQR